MKPADMKTQPSPGRTEARITAYRDLSFVYEGQSSSNCVRGADLSPKGMFINTVEALSEGAVLKVEFRLPDSQEVIKARGEVRYCQAGVGVGVEFIDISPGINRPSGSNC